MSAGWSRKSAQSHGGIGPRCLHSTETQALIWQREHIMKLLGHCLFSLALICNYIQCYTAAQLWFRIFPPCSWSCELSSCYIFAFLRSVVWPKSQGPSRYLRHCLWSMMIYHGGFINHFLHLWWISSSRLKKILNPISHRQIFKVRCSLGWSWLNWISHWFNLCLPRQICLGSDQINQLSVKMLKRRMRFFSPQQPSRCGPSTYAQHMYLWQWPWQLWLVETKLVLQP